MMDEREEQNPSTKAAERTFEMWRSSTSTNQNYIDEECEGRSNGGSTFYHFVHNFTTHLQSKNVKTKMYKTQF
jgi:hypothetical protein